MNKVSSRIICLALLVLASGGASAAAGWSDSTIILELNQQGTTGVGANLVFIETSLTSNPSGCSHAKGFYFAVNDDRQQRLFAMLLAAQMASRNVKIYTTGSCHATWGYAQLDGVVVN
jgi:hypothetical protein